MSKENTKNKLQKISGENEPYCERCGEQLALTNQPRYKTVDGKEICGACKEEQMQEGGAAEVFEGFVPDHSKKEHHYPRKPMKHHVKPKNFLEQVDVDVDQLSGEDVHPDDPNWQEMMTPEQWDESSDYTQEDDDWKNERRKRKASVRKNQLLKMAEALESPNNETLIAAEHDEDLLNRVASSFMKAANALREAADDMAAFEPAPEAFTAQKLDEIAAVAEAFAESDDELLQKQAAVLDDLLITLASPQNAGLFSVAAEGDRIAELKKKYNETREKQLEWNKVSEAIKDIEKSPVYKEYRILEQPLNTRYCPVHHGTSTTRVGEHTVRCPIDGKTFNFDEGYEGLHGKIPGGAVQNQSSMDGNNTFTAFNGDTRAMRMGYNPGE